MQLLIRPDSSVLCVYGEALDLRALGALQIRRASHVEPGEDGCWQVDLQPVGGPVLGSFEKRSQALAAEREWLQLRWLNGGATDS